MFRKVHIAVEVSSRAIMAICTRCEDHDSLIFSRVWRRLSKRLLSPINLPLKIDCLLIDGVFDEADLFAWLDQKKPAVSDPWTVSFKENLFQMGVDYL